MADRQLWPKSKDASTLPEGGVLNLPTPRDPLREWTDQNVNSDFMIASMEAVMQIARLQPDFEARRLARKSAARFTY